MISSCLKYFIYCIILHIFSPLPLIFFFKFCINMSIFLLNKYWAKIISDDLFDFGKECYKTICFCFELLC